MKLRWLRTFSWRTLAAALVAAGIIHIFTTLAIPHVSASGAFHRLKAALPVNQLVVVPQVSAAKQLLPFMTPDVRYAICRFDISRGSVTVTASLLDPSWTLALYTPTGDNFYYALGLASRQFKVSFNLVPPGERFLGIFPTGRDTPSDRQKVQVPGKEGLVVIRAPMNGTSFTQEVDEALKGTDCRPLAQP